MLSAIEPVVIEAASISIVGLRMLAVGTQAAIIMGMGITELDSCTKFGGERADAK